MPRFYVDFVQNGTESADTVGQDFDGEADVRREAIKALAEIAAEEIPRDGPFTLTATVYDESGELTFVCSVKFEFSGGKPVA